MTKRQEYLQKAIAHAERCQFEVGIGDAANAAGSAWYAFHYGRKYRRASEARARRRGIADAYASVGMRRVRGAQGGTYYE